MVYEMNNLPILDPRKITETNQDKMRIILPKLIEAQRKKEKDIEEEMRKNLDKIVFDTLGLTGNEQIEIFEGLRSLKQMRLQRKNVEVLVETKEQWKPSTERHKAREREGRTPSKRLDMWI